MRVFIGTAIAIIYSSALQASSMAFSSSEQISAKKKGRIIEWNVRPASATDKEGVHRILQTSYSALLPKDYDDEDVLTKALPMITGAPTASIAHIMPHMVVCRGGAPDDDRRYCRMRWMDAASTKE
jgi:hypothetical protein